MTWHKHVRLITSVLINPFPHILAASDEKSFSLFWLQHCVSKVMYIGANG